MNDDLSYKNCENRGTLCLSPLVQPPEERLPLDIQILASSAICF